jgi:hypothetical protein
MASDKFRTVVASADYQHVPAVYCAALCYSSHSHQRSAPSPPNLSCCFLLLFCRWAGTEAPCLASPTFSDLRALHLRALQKPPTITTQPTQPVSAACCAAFSFSSPVQMGQHRSPLSCLTHILRLEGISGLCRGYLPTLCRELPGNAIFFTTYEGLRRALPGRGAAAEGLDGAGGSSSRSTLAAAWHVAVDAGGAIFCGAAAGIVVSASL